jgi:carbonic anhydrase
MESNSEIAIVGAMYDIETGKVKFNVDLTSVQSTTPIA